MYFRVSVILFLLACVVIDHNSTEIDDSDANENDANDDDANDNDDNDANSLENEDNEIQNNDFRRPNDGGKIVHHGLIATLLSTSLVNFSVTTFGEISPLWRIL